LAAANKEKDARERRELAYWCVLGVGRIAGD
jgi:dynactin-4